MTDPRPEVVAARQALVIALWGRQVTADVAALADTILAHLPGSWRLVDMDALVERVARALKDAVETDEDYMWDCTVSESVRDKYRAEARRLLDGEPR